MTPMLTAITAPAKARNADPKYCIAYDDVTGSRVAQQECKTRAQWAKEGVNIDETVTR